MLPRFHLDGVVHAWKPVVGDVAHVRLDCTLHGRAAVAVPLGEARGGVEEAEDVVGHEDLPRRGVAGADPDGRDAQPLGDVVGDLRGDTLEHDGEAAGLLQRLGVGDERGGGRGGLPLHPVPPQLAVRLRRQTDVPHHRDTARDDRLDLVAHAHPALQLDAVGAALLEHAYRVLGRRGGGQVGPEGEVPDDQRALRPTRHRLGVVDHLRHVHGCGRVVP